MVKLSLTTKSTDEPPQQEKPAREGGEKRPFLTDGSGEVAEEADNSRNEAVDGGSGPGKSQSQPPPQKRTLPYVLSPAKAPIWLSLDLLLLSAVFTFLACQGSAAGLVATILSLICLVLLPMAYRLRIRLLRAPACLLFIILTIAAVFGLLAAIVLQSVVALFYLNALHFRRESKLVALMGDFIEANTCHDCPIDQLNHNYRYLLVPFIGWLLIVAYRVEILAFSFAPVNGLTVPLLKGREEAEAGEAEPEEMEMRRAVAGDEGESSTTATKRTPTNDARAETGKERHRRHWAEKWLSVDAFFLTLASGSLVYNGAYWQGGAFGVATLLAWVLGLIGLKRQRQRLLWAYVALATLCLLWAAYGLYGGFGEMLERCSRCSTRDALPPPELHDRLLPPLQPRYYLHRLLFPVRLAEVWRQALLHIHGSSESDSPPTFRQIHHHLKELTALTAPCLH